MLPALAFIITLIITALLTPLVRKLAVRFDVLDYPDGDRKIHATPTPLLGGISLYVGFTVVVGSIFFMYPGVILGKDLSISALWGVALGGAILMFGGWFDDRYRLAPRYQLLWSATAAIMAMLSGVGAHVITNPCGGVITLTPIVSAVVTFGWLMGIMYTTKLLDGLDGLVTGIGAIGSLIVFSLTQFTPFYQP